VLHFIDHAPNFKSPVVRRIIEKNEAAAFQILIAVLEVPPREFVRVVPVYVAKADGASEFDLAAKYVGTFFLASPRLEELVRKQLDREGQIVAAK
jgi:hypothetical protein